MPDIQRFSLTNGLPVYVISLPYLHALRLDFFLRDGSRWEDKDTNGLAHFTEHMLFGGNQRYPGRREMALAIAQIGGAANGETGPEVTGFYLATRPVHLARAMDLFGAMITQPLFNPADIETERRIVLAEIDEELRKGSVDALLWPGHPLSYYISGSRQNVRHFDREVLLDHHRRFYTPDNSVLVVSGPVTAAGVRALAEKSFSPLGGRFKERALPASDAAPSRSRVRFATVADIPSQAISLAYPVERPEPRRQAALSLLNAMLGASDTSRLFLNLRETLGLVYSIESMLTFWMDTGALSIEIGVSARNLRRALREALQEIQRLAAEEVSEAELDRAKEWQIANLEGLLDEPAGFARRLSLEVLFQDMPSVEDAIELTGRIRPEEIRAEALEVLRPEAARLFLQGPDLTEAARAEIRGILRQYARGT